MKTIIPLLLLGILGLVVLGGAQVLPPPAQRGKVLLLDNDQILEGDIERIGEQYRIRRTVGETWVPANRVSLLCGSLDDLLQYQRKKANLYDPDERLRLANWCRNHGLIEHALIEVQAALKLRADHVPSQRMLTSLQALRSPRLDSTTKGDPDLVSSGGVDLSAEAMVQFTTRIQPILMNACASCHATNRGGNFRLTRVLDGSMIQRRTTLGNAAAVLAQLNLESPHNSTLLTKAISVHGEMTQPAFQNRQAPAYRALEDWVRSIASTAPVPPARDTLTLTPGNGEASFATVRPAGSPVQPGEMVAPRTPPTTVTRPEPGTPRSVPTTPTPTPTPAEPKPADPFDPEGFNRLNPMAPPPAAPRQP